MVLQQWAAGSSAVLVYEWQLVLEKGSCPPLEVAHGLWGGLGGAARVAAMAPLEPTGGVPVAATAPLELLRGLEGLS